MCRRVRLRQRWRGRENALSMVRQVRLTCKPDQRGAAALCCEIDGETGAIIVPAESGRGHFSNRFWCDRDAPKSNLTESYWEQARHRCCGLPRLVRRRAQDVPFEVTVHHPPDGPSQGVGHLRDQGRKTSETVARAEGPDGLPPDLVAPQLMWRSVGNRKKVPARKQGPVLSIDRFTSVEPLDAT